jgi:elongation factor Ts
VPVKPQDVKKLREHTGAGVMAAKNALVEAGGEFERAVEILRQQGMANAAKKADREVKNGLVEAYVHAGKIGVVVEVNCETDFVARTDDFKNFAHDVAMHIAAADPRHPQELAAQPFIKDPDRTVTDLTNETIAKLGENIVIRRFKRLELGVSED